MEPDKKARRLVEKFYKATVSVESIGDKSSAKQCALICVERNIERLNKERNYDWGLEGQNLIDRLINEELKIKTSLEKL